MPVSASEMMPKALVPWIVMIDLTSAPLAASSMTLEESATPKSSEPAATVCTVLAEPRPSFRVRSMPSSL
jgi:hypothetical protein